MLITERGFSMNKLEVRKCRRKGVDVLEVKHEGYTLDFHLIGGQATLFGNIRGLDGKKRRGKLVPRTIFCQAREAANRIFKPQSIHPAFDKSIPIQDESPQGVLQF